MKNLPPTKSERTRRFIIEKAAPIFNKKGITGTTLSDLTEATGLTKGGIYGNFKDKDSVAVAVFQYHVENLTAFLQKEIGQGNSSIEKLLAIPKAYRKLYSTMMAYGGCPILNTAAEADDTHQALCRLAADAFESMKKTIISLIKNGQSFDEIRHETDPETVADIILSLIEGGTLLSKATGQDTYMMRCLDHMEGLIHDIRITN